MDREKMAEKGNGRRDLELLGFHCSSCMCFNEATPLWDTRINKNKLNKLSFRTVVLCRNECSLWQRTTARKVTFTILFTTVYKISIYRLFLWKHEHRHSISFIINKSRVIFYVGVLNYFYSPFYSNR